MIMNKKIIRKKFKIIRLDLSTSKNKQTKKKKKKKKHQSTYLSSVSQSAAREKSFTIGKRNSKQIHIPWLYITI